MFSLFKKKTQLQESSMNFDMEHLERFLLRLVGLIPDGFGQAEVTKLMMMARAMAHDEERSHEFTIQIEGRQSPFKVRIFMDDIDSPDVYFFSPAGLATKIDEEMERFCEELGL